MAYALADVLYRTNNLTSPGLGDAQIECQQGVGLPRLLQRIWLGLLVRQTLGEVKQ